MYSIQPIGSNCSGELDLDAPFDYFLETLVDLADQGSFLRLKVAAPELPENDDEYATVWARDLPIPKPSLPRWLREELAALKRDAKRGRRRRAYADAQRLGLYSAPSNLGKVQRVRYLRPEDLELPPQPYPTKESWDPQAWIPYDAAFLEELAGKQRLAAEDRWIGPALRGAGSRVQWLCLCRAAFVSSAEYDELSVEPCTRTRPYPNSIALIHPTEGRIVLYVMPQGRIATIEFAGRALQCSVECDQLA